MRACLVDTLAPSCSALCAGHACGAAWLLGLPTATQGSAIQTMIACCTFLPAGGHTQKMHSGTQLWPSCSRPCHTLLSRQEHLSRLRSSTQRPSLCVACATSLRTWLSLVAELCSLPVRCSQREERAPTAPGRLQELLDVQQYVIPEVTHTMAMLASFERKNSISFGSATFKPTCALRRPFTGPWAASTPLGLFCKGLCTPRAPRACQPVARCRAQGSTRLRGRLAGMAKPRLARPMQHSRARRTESAQAPLVDSMPSTETVQRPVIRWNRHWVFTRIEPELAQTSMVMMLRPGWPEYWSSLTGLPWPEVVKGALVDNEADRQAAWLALPVCRPLACPSAADPSRQRLHLIGPVRALHPGRADCCPKQVHAHALRP